MFCVTVASEQLRDNLGMYAMGSFMIPTWHISNVIVVSWTMPLPSPRRWGSLLITHFFKLDNSVYILAVNIKNLEVKEVWMTSSALAYTTPFTAGFTVVCLPVRLMWVWSLREGRAEHGRVRQEWCVQCRPSRDDERDIAGTIAGTVGALADAKCATLVHGASFDAFQNAGKVFEYVAVISSFQNRGGHGDDDCPSHLGPKCAVTSLRIGKLCKMLLPSKTCPWSWCCRVWQHGANSTWAKRSLVMLCCCKTMVLQARKLLFSALSTHVFGERQVPLVKLRGFFTNASVSRYAPSSKNTGEMDWHEWVRRSCKRRKAASVEHTLHLMNWIREVSWMRCRREGKSRTNLVSWDAGGR